MLDQIRPTYETPHFYISLLVPKYIRTSVDAVVQEQKMELAGLVEFGWSLVHTFL
jgi:hypothetical protein